MGRLCVSSDRVAIERRLRTDPYAHLYGLGDLDDEQWPKTKWFLWDENGATRAAFFLYSSGATPTLIALESDDRTAGVELLRAMRESLPSEFHAHLSPYLVSELENWHRLRDSTACFKMRFVPGADHLASSEAEVVSLGPADVARVREFYAHAYPQNWFDPDTLRTGLYRGAQLDESLVAIAGTHVFSRRRRVAAIGNVATRGDCRGRGHATSVVRALCRAAEPWADHIGLNVKAENIGAIRCYERLGFSIHCEYAEAYAARR